MECNKNLENLEKICGSGFGQSFLEEVGKICVDILKKGYRADSTPTAKETYGYLMTKGAKLNSNNDKTDFAYSLLSKRGLVKAHHAGGYTITESGKEIVNKYFRTKGEYFGTFDRIHQFVEEYEKKGKK